MNRSCRPFLAFGTAFYCPPDGQAYITAPRSPATRAAFGDRLPYALAAIVAHEAGHRVQYAVEQPELDGRRATRPAGWSSSRRTAWPESGRTARPGAGCSTRPASGPRTRKEMRLVSALKPPAGAGLDDYDEVATHGTPAQRVAAFDRGASAAANPCRLRGRG